MPSQEVFPPRYVDATLPISDVSQERGFPPRYVDATLRKDDSKRFPPRVRGCYHVHAINLPGVLTSGILVSYNIRRYE